MVLMWKFGLNRCSWQSFGEAAQIPLGDLQAGGSIHMIVTVLGVSQGVAPRAFLGRSINGVVHGRPEVRSRRSFESMCEHRSQNLAICVPGSDLRSKNDVGSMWSTRHSRLPECQ